MFAQYVNYLTLLSCFITGAVVERALGKLVRDQVKRLLLVTILGNARCARRILQHDECGYRKGTSISIS